MTKRLRQSNCLTVRLFFVLCSYKTYIHGVSQVRNSRYGSDAEVGNYTCISERSASTIDYIIVDDNLSNYITDFEVGDRLEPIHMPLVLDLQFGFVEDVEDSGVNETNNICPPKYTWNSENQQTYNNQLRLNFERISNDFHNSIANKLFPVTVTTGPRSSLQCSGNYEKTRF